MPAIKIRVPQADGEIVIHTFDGPEQRFAVKEGVVSAKDQPTADLLLARITDATLDNAPAAK